MTSNTKQVLVPFETPTVIANLLVVNKNSFILELICECVFSNTDYQKGFGFSNVSRSRTFTTNNVTQIDNKREILQN